MISSCLIAVLAAASLSAALVTVAVRRPGWRRGRHGARAHFDAELLDTLHDAVFSLSPDRRILTWNKAAERIYGWTAAEAVGKRASDLLRPEFGGGLTADQVYAEVARTGDSRHEVLQQRRDGSRVVLDGHAVAVRDRGGALAGFVVANRDVTERRRAEEALRASEAKFRAGFHGAGIAICLLDGEGRHLDYNRAYQSMLGYSDAELQRMTIAQLLHPEDAAVAREGFADALAGRKDLVVGERRYLRRDGSYAQGLLRSTVVRDTDGRFLFTVGLIEDVTQKKALEAQLAFADRMASMGTLAAGVAHEINNPLSFILANIDYLREELGKASPAPQELLQALEETREGAARVRAIVRDLKTFSRGGDDVDEPNDVRPVLQSSLNLTQNEIRHRARLVLDLQEVPPVRASAHRLGQVFVNLLINAAQALPDDQPDRHQIRVSCRSEAHWVVVEVGDTGRGIPPEDLKRIFEPFFTTKPVGVGTGLGLAICHGIVQRLGGEIRVESVPGKGSSFRVLLPSAAAGPREDAMQRPPARAPARARVLVVDDEPMVAKAVARTLAQHEVVTVAAARDALARIEQGDRFDVIVCDLMMPEMTGMELHDRISASNPALASRVVFLTGGAFTPLAREFLDRVPNPRIDKPFDADALRAVIERTGTLRA